jgi:hypothetical protein
MPNKPEDHRWTQINTDKSGFNAETQRFAEERRERRKKMLFSSAFLRALCVSALKLVWLRLRLCRSATLCGLCGLCVKS